MTTPPYLKKSSVVEGPYRYALTRTWDEGLPRCNFVMLNPSTADALVDDPTVRRCVGFSRAWGYGSLEVTNLFAWRATNPRVLRDIPDPIGRLNDTFIKDAAVRAALVIVAWGSYGELKTRGREVLELLRAYKPQCFTITANGQPGHPLYQPAYRTTFQLLAEVAK